MNRKSIQLTLFALAALVGLLFFGMKAGARVADFGTSGASHTTQRSSAASKCFRIGAHLVMRLDLGTPEHKRSTFSIKERSPGRSRKGPISFRR